MVYWRLRPLPYLCIRRKLNGHFYTCQLPGNTHSHIFIEFNMDMQDNTMNTFTIKAQSARTRRIKITLTVIAVLLSALLIWANIPDSSLPANTVIDRLEVLKSQRRLNAYSQGDLVAQYPISLGRVPVGHKIQEGDKKTPEGIYSIDYKKENSCCHRALHISYPDQAAIERARELGVAPGGLIMLHGLARGLGWLGKLHRLVDWTSGCIGLTNFEIEELFGAVKVGASIEILP
jgi:hypothetical protein